MRVGLLTMGVIALALLACEDDPREVVTVEELQATAGDASSLMVNNQPPSGAGRLSVPRPPRENDTEAPAPTPNVPPAGALLDAEVDPNPFEPNSEGAAPNASADAGFVLSPTGGFVVGTPPGGTFAPNEGVLEQ